MINLIIGHQAPKGSRTSRFNSIEINGDFAYCESHNFVYQPDAEKEKLYNAQPCYYTDKRYHYGDSIYNSYMNAKLHWTRHHSVSLEYCKRRVRNCKNIPKGTIVEFDKSWYYRNKQVNNSFKYIVRKENQSHINFEINKPEYSKQFTDCEFSKSLVDALRKNGFIVSVSNNESFITNMINTAITLTGNDNIEDSEIEGETAIAYGYGKKIGFSSHQNDFMGYSNGCSNILWDEFGEFNKWSQSNEIDKSTSIDEIIKILMSKD